METPVFTIRLSDADRELVRKMAETYGAPNVSVFIRELLLAMCSGDDSKAAAFTGKLASGMALQMRLPLEKPLPQVALTGSFRKRMRQAKRHLAAKGGHDT